MSVIATALKHLIAAGVSGDDLVRAIAEIEAAAQPVADAQADRRRAKDRERKRLRKSAESAETAEDAETPSLPPSPQTPQPPTHPRDETTRAREGLAASVVIGLPVVDGDWPEGDARRHADLLAQEASTHRLDPAKTEGLLLTSARLAAWRSAGASWQHDVVPTVTALARRSGRRITSWKFFDDAIAQSIADNRAALTIPEARHAAAPHEPGADHRHTARLDNYASHWAGAEQAADVMAARRSL